MKVILATHIVAGSLGLIAGFIALYSAKGAPLHRQAGAVFVYSMLAMCAAGFTMAIGRSAGHAVWSTSRRAQARAPSVAHVIRVLHRGTLVFHRSGESDSQAGANRSAACHAGAPGDRHDVLLVMAREDSAVTPWTDARDHSGAGIVSMTSRLEERT